MPEKFPPENAVDIVEKLSAKGNSQKTIARALGISHELWRHWRDEKYPKLGEAFERGRAVEHDKLVGALFDTAINGKGAQAVTAAIFLLKARHGYNENAIPDQNGPQVNITFELPGAVDPKTYEAQVLKKAVEPGKSQKKKVDTNDRAD